MLWLEIIRVCTEPFQFIQNFSFNSVCSWKVRKDGKQKFQQTWVFHEEIWWYIWLLGFLVVQQSLLKHVLWNLRSGERSGKRMAYQNQKMRMGRRHPQHHHQQRRKSFHSCRHCQYHLQILKNLWWKQLFPDHKTVMTFHPMILCWILNDGIVQKLSFSFILSSDYE